MLKTVSQRQVHSFHFYLQQLLTLPLQLHALIVSAASVPLVNEPSAADLQRLRKLEAAAKARRRAEKDQRRDLKRSRSIRDWD